MMAIKKYIDDKRVSTSMYVYLTVAKIGCERFLHRPSYDRHCAFDLLEDFKFWSEVENDDFLAKSKAKLTNITHLAPSERFVFVLHSHGDKMGYVMMGMNLVSISDILKPLESYLNIRVTIVSGSCYAGTSILRNAITGLGVPGSQVGHSATVAFADSVHRSASNKERDTIFITNVLKTADPSKPISIHTTRTRDLILNKGRG